VWCVVGSVDTAFSSKSALVGVPGGAGGYDDGCIASSCGESLPVDSFISEVCSCRRSRPIVSGNRIAVAIIIRHAEITMGGASLNRIMIEDSEVNATAITTTSEATPLRVTSTHRRAADLP
jgi:hypothetical protein